ncbi:unnamed protein product [Didymodactylos carnosus]|uniref:NADAR domain-containing protein n=1 Tax=Didymodactylos carnosus TaxID=1234261 RepID=A0A813WQA2_9BILA|nr:unnamed protein product [Didymodactylos carnosus]CAF3643383.1 unnamed protein product [Didymodactylos carnosus]
MATSNFENELIERVLSKADKSETYTYFWKTESPFSNFHPCTVSVDNLKFSCTEQYMMYNKAILFDDKIIAAEIINAHSPRAMKALGRKVSNFNPDIWLENRSKIVSNGNYLKFTQNEHLKKALLEQHGKILVEASPNDQIWGIGMDQSNPRVANRSEWKGLNLLGFILTDICNKIYEEQKQS